MMPRSSAQASMFFALPFVTRVRVWMAMTTSPASYGARPRAPAPAFARAPDALMPRGRKFRCDSLAKPKGRSTMHHPTRTLLLSLALAGLIGTLAATGVIAKTTVGIVVSPVVDVTRDDISQNESPLAVNPTNEMNMITGNNDWNYNDGCGMNVTFDAGKTWTPSLPNGFLPGITKFTNDPNVAGTGAYDAGGDPAVAFGPDGTAYFVCQAFNFTPPFAIAMLANRSTDGGKTWLASG